MPIRGTTTSLTTARSAWSFTILMAFLAVASVPARSAELLTNQAIRLRVLQTTFPGATISRSTGPLEDLSLNLDCCKELPLNDAFKDDHLYEIVAPPTKAEADPASDVTEPEKPLSTKRLVRLQVYRQGSQDGHKPLLVAIVNYWFRPANPPNCCQAIGKVLLLSAHGDRVLDSFDNMPNAFTMFTSIKFLDVDNSGIEKLFLAADYSSPGDVGINLKVFDVSGLKIRPVLEIGSASSWPEKYSLTFDQMETVAAKGKRFWFTKIVYGPNGTELLKPVISKVSFSVGEGVDRGRQ